MRSLESGIKILETSIDQLQKRDRTEELEEKKKILLSKWTNAWKLSNCYAVLLNGAKNILIGLERSDLIISEGEAEITAYDTLPSDTSVLRDIIVNLAVSFS